MSVQVMTAVFEHSETRGNERLVLLALADNAHEETWSCWPSVKRIASKARVSERTAQRCLRSLHEHGHIVVVERKPDDHRYATNRYIVLRPWADEGCQVVTPVNLTGDKARVEGCQDARSGVSAVSPKPSLEPSVEPSSLRASRSETTKPPRGTRCPDPFFVTAEMREWATDEGITIDVAAQTKRFVDYWRGVSGQRGSKADWTATWRNWIRRAQDDARPTNGRKTKSQLQVDAINEVSAQFKEMS